MPALQFSGTAKNSQFRHGVPLRRLERGFLGRCVLVLPRMVCGNEGSMGLVDVAGYRFERPYPIGRVR